MVTTRNTSMYNAWRESESYQVPMTDEGVELADRRLKSFTKGWNAAIKQAQYVLMEKHEENDHIHNIYHVSANIVKGLGDDNDK